MTDDTIDAVSKALRRAWQLGQTYWQQADSESWTQQAKSDGTQKKFEALIDETRALLESKPAVPGGWKLVPVEMNADMLAALRAPLGSTEQRYKAMLAASPAAPAQPCGEDAANGAMGEPVDFVFPPMPPAVVMHEKIGPLFDRLSMQFYAARYMSLAAPQPASGESV